MAEIKPTIDVGEEIISWQVPEYEKHERTRRWYIIATAVALALLLYAFFTRNYLFFGIIVMGAMVIIFLDGREPEMVDFSITDEGVIIGKKFHDHDTIKDFSIVYKPSQQVKRLYFEFKNTVKPRLSIPLENEDPLVIRRYLLKYLKEDLERTDQPTSEGLAKLFKL